MLVIGTYQDGKIELEKNYASINPVKVIVTFLEDVQLLPQEKLSLKDFSFSESKKNLENFKGSFADAVVEERRRRIQ